MPGCAEIEKIMKDTINNRNIDFLSMPITPLLKG